MMVMQPTLPKKRIDVIDALRGFAILGICILHTLDHFDSGSFAGEASPIMQWLNQAVRNIVDFIILGKAYAIFSMLFGLSFFIQMQNQADRGIDFRLRFAWRLFILLCLGYINSMFYAGEILMTYAVFGLVLIPLYKVPTKWLVVIGIILLFQIPNVIHLIRMIFFDSELAATTPDIRKFSWALNSEVYKIRVNGTFAEVMASHAWKGKLATWLYYIQPVQACRILGLFILGMLIGRKGIHKDPGKMVFYAKKAVLGGLVFFTVFYFVFKLVPLCGIEGKWALRSAQTLIKTYYNLGLMFVWVGTFILIYFRLDGEKRLNKLAPVGRMSLTNYMMQSVLGSLIFFKYGLGLAPLCGNTVTFLIGLTFCTFQIWFSTWWMKRYYYGPVEWLWRSLTWVSFKKPFKRPSAQG